MDNIVALIVLVCIAALLWPPMLLGVWIGGVIAGGVIAVVALWIGWAFFDRWWLERKAENSNPNPVRDRSG